jgi:tRNA(Ile)-lysidine synthase
MHPFETAFHQAWPAEQWSDSHVLLAVSGGADSVAMLRAALAAKSLCGGNGQLFVGHLDHGLRGDASAADAKWLEMLCDRLGVPLEIGTRDVAPIADMQGDGVEAAARAARYGFLQRSAEKLGARFVAVAHTADDQIETVLHRILRGTGIGGLRGIPSVRSLSPSATLVRPLVGVRRADVLAYLAAINQDYRTDASNADLRWTRNRLRHELLPALRKYYGGDIDAALLRISRQAAESHDFITAIAARLTNDCVTLEFAPSKNAGKRPVDCIRIACEKLVDQPALFIGEVCKAAWRQADWPEQSMGYDQWHLLASLVADNPRSSKLNLPGNIQAWRAGEELICERHGTP